jgi:DNA polymerase-3 subunit delta
MQLRAEQLEAHLGKSLAGVYAIHGDEPLLALEAADALRAAARKRGFAEREVLEPNRYFDWSEFHHAAQSQSLFGGKKIVELRLPTGKPGTPGAEAIGAYCERPNPEVLLIVSLPRLDRNSQGSAWFSALGTKGVVVDVFPVDRTRLAAWLGERLARQKQSAGREVLEFLAGRIEGNLLAAHQELQKLTLLAPPGELTMETVQPAVASVARYDPNGAAEALLAGDAARYVRVIEGLRGEGEQPTFILFVLCSVLFVLQGALRGAPVDPLFYQHKLFNKPLQRSLQAALGKGSRFSAARVDAALSQAALIDRAIKGVHAADPWEALIRLGLKLTHGSNA